MRWCSMGLVLVASMVFAAKDANASNWKVMGKSNSATYYADVDSAKTLSEEQYRSIRTRTKFKKIQAGNGKYFRSLKQLVYIDCDHHEMATKSVYAYKNDNFSGPPVFSVTYKDYMLDFSAESPDSVGDILIKLLCKN